MTEKQLHHSRNLVQQKNIPCNWCKNLHSVANVKNHEKSCSENPSHPRRKTCITCGASFIAPAGKRGLTQKTCSRSCSNTQYRSGPNNGNWKHPDDRTQWSARYRTRCFEHHEKKCVICGEENVVAVHHMDENHENEAPENLIPLCPTHHVYWHSKFRHMIEDKVNRYILEWKENRRVG